VTGPFRSQSPLTYPLLFVYGLLLRLSAFLDPSPPVTGPADGFLYAGLVSADGGCRRRCSPTRSSCPPCPCWVPP